MLNINLMNQVVMIDQIIDLINLATAVVTTCSAIAALTPTPVDDSLVAKAYKIVDFLAINIGQAKN